MDSVELSRPRHDSEEYFRLLVTSIKDYAVFLLDPDGHVMTWNLGAELLKGYKPHEVIGKSFKVFYSNEDVERRHPENELRIARETGRYEEEGWRIRKDGTHFWANVVITRLLDEHGRMVGFAKITRDLTERRRAEQSLRESEERFRLIVENVKDHSIITLDTEGNIVSWNEGARRLKGYESAEICGRHFSVFYDAEDVAIGKCEYELREAATTGRFEDEGWRVRKDGTRFWANVVITALHDSTGRLHGFSKVTRDITERKRAEDKLRMAHESLERRVIERTRELQRAIESRDEFMSIASHELRTPLTALKLQQQLFERQLARAKDGTLSVGSAREMSSVIGRQIVQLTRLIDDMLDVSRIATGRLRLELGLSSISDLVIRSYESFTAQFMAAGIQATLDCEPDLILTCDAQRLEQVINNLLANAIKYGRGAPVEVRAHAVNQGIEISVRDHGPGIAPADQERIFERYERAVTANEASGLGLGLFISRQIVDSHGGALKVLSTPGRGATFIATLPLTFDI